MLELSGADFCTIRAIRIARDTMLRVMRPRVRIRAGSVLCAAVGHYGY